MKKNCLVLASVIIMLMIANLFAVVSRGERPYIDIYQVPDSAIVPGLIRVKLSENYSHISLSTRTLDGQLKRSGETEWDALCTQYGVSKINLLFDSPALATRYTDRHREWGFDRWLELEIDSKANIRDIVMEYRKLGDIVEFAEPEYKKVLYADPNGFVPISLEELQRWSGNDPRLGEQWHYNNTGQQAGTAGKDISLFDAWNIEKGHQDVIVAVIDGGIQINHPDLAANIWSGVGYNFVTNSSTITADDHGTHVAGTIAAVNNNGAGVAGIAGGSSPTRGISLMSCQVFAGNSGSGFDVAPVWAADHGAAISQNSWGYQNVNVFNQTDLDAIDYFNLHGGGTVLNGGLTIFAAGNDNAEGNWYPGCYSGAMAVAATNNKDIRSSYSNYGIWVEISAPGGETAYANDPKGVLSTISGNSYAFYQGTSMACPHVSGVAALVLSYAHRNGVAFTNTELRNLLKSTTDDHYAVNPSYIGKLGTGRLNAHAALLAVNPSLPSVSITTPSNSSVHDLGATIAINATATDSDGSITSVAFYVDDILKFTDYSAPYSWNWNTTSFSAGVHTIKAIATDNDANTAVHSISIRLDAPADEGFESGNFSAYPWLNSSPIPWTVQNSEKYSGTYAAKSGAISDNAQTDLSVTLYVSQAGNISFYQKVSSENNYDKLFFLIDNVSQGEWSGAGNWSYQSYQVNPGNHTFTWRYAKDRNTIGGSDCAWIDHIVFPPLGVFYAPPQNLSATPADGSITLNWDATGDTGVQNYKVYRNGNLLQTTPNLSYQDLAVTNGNTYSYYVIAVYAGGESEPTPTANVIAGAVLDAILGTGTSTTVINPINIYYKSSHGQSVYTKAELNAAGISGPIYITQLGFNVATAPLYNLPNFIVRMKHTTATNVSSWQNATGMETVYSTTSYVPQTGWDMLTLSSPFLWNGMDNIVVDTAFGIADNWNNSGTVYYSTSTYGYRYIRSDNANQTNIFSGGDVNNNRPNLKLVFAPPPEITVPFVDGFESGADDWAIVNGTQVNKWHWGTATANTGTHSLYISKDGGTSNSYDETKASLSHFYTNVSFPTSSQDFYLRFNWKANGQDAANDYLQVYLTEPTITPSAGTELSTGALVTGALSNSNDWQNYSIQLPANLAGSTKRLIFSWKNNSSTGTQAPAAIDNIRIVEAEQQDIAVVVGTESEIELPELTLPDNTTINASVIINGVSGSTVDYWAGYNSVGSNLNNAGLDIRLIVDSFSGSELIVNINHNLGFIPPTIAYSFGGGAWNMLTNPGTWTENDADLNITVDPQRSSELIIVFSDSEENTLPVTLSSFTAVHTGQGYVRVDWATASETAVLGYYILRSNSAELSEAVAISSLIAAANASNGAYYSFRDKSFTESSTYYYWLSNLDFNGIEGFFGPLAVHIDNMGGGSEPIVPLLTEALGNYPNPFNPVTNLRYALAKAGEVNVQIYNNRGQLVRTLSQQHSQPGYFSLIFDGKDSAGLGLSSGVYFYRTRIGEYSATNRMLLLK